MSYIALLNTPHSERYPGVNTEPLPVVLAGRGSGPAGEAPTQALEVLEEVRRCLHFEKLWTHRNRLSPEEVARGQATDCLGYVAVAAEALDEVAADYLIGYVDTHFFIALPNDARTSFFMATVENPSLNGNMEPYLFAMDSPKIPSTLAQHDRASARFHTHAYVERELPMWTFGSLLEKGEAPWIQRKTKRYLLSRGSDSLPRAGTTSVTYFEPKLGKQAVEGKAQLNYAYEQKNFAEMAAIVVGMGAAYPEANVQPASQWLIRAIIRGVLSEDVPAIDVAVGANDVVRDAVLISGDARANILHAQLQAEIGRTAKSASLVRSAIAEYDVAFESLHVSSQYVGLRNKALGYLAAL